MLALGAVVVAAGTLFTSSNAEAGVRRFYWTSESQSYSYNVYQGREECFSRAESEAYPYAYNTCVQRIGSNACSYSRTWTERLNFGGQPGLFDCRVRVWVEAWE